MKKKIQPEYRRIVSRSMNFMDQPGKPTFMRRLKTLIFGGKHNIDDSSIFHKLSLIAFFAWVGLGADGLSSSCYGPEEAFLAFHGHIYLSVFVALMSGITVFVIAASYSQIIELFPIGRRRISRGEQAAVAHCGHGLGIRAPDRLRAHDHDFRRQRRRCAVQLSSPRPGCRTSSCSRSSASSCSRS